MKSLLFLILMYSVQYVRAQDCAYGNYYHLTQEAYEEYDSKNYKMARAKFILAFNEGVFPLGKDVENALLLAVKLKDNAWSHSLAIQLAKGGVPLKYFNKFRHLPWYNDLDADFESYSNYYYQNFDCDLKQELLNIRNHDIAHNKLLHSLREGNDIYTFGEVLDSAIKLVSDFNKMCIDFGFPTEQKMGYYFLNNKVADYPVGILLVHIYQNGELLFYDELDKLACQGVINDQYRNTLKSIRGFGNSTGVEQEIRARFQKYRK